MVERIWPTALPGPRYRYAPFTRFGPFVQSAGLVGLDPETERLAIGGPGPETRQILRNLDASMRELGLSSDHLTVARIYTTSMARFDDINAEWDAFFDTEGIVPARVAVGVSALPIGASVEIEFQFYKED